MAAQLLAKNSLPSPFSNGTSSTSTSESALLALCTNSLIRSRFVGTESVTMKWNLGSPDSINAETNETIKGPDPTARTLA